MLLPTPPYSVYKYVKLHLSDPTSTNAPSIDSHLLERVLFNMSIDICVKIEDTVNYCHYHHNRPFRNGQRWVGTFQSQAIP